MSGDDLIATGSGRVRYLLMIEGWPHLFATDDSITCADWLDGRTVLPGLSYMSGAAISDRIQPSAGKVEADGITFKIVPPYGTQDATSMDDPVTESLAYYPEPYASLSKDAADALEDDTTTIALEGGVFLEQDHVYHLGTEAIRCTDEAGTTIERHIWDTLPQSHHTSRIDATRSVYVYEHPPTMQGRHAYLYRFDDADDNAGGSNGNLDSQQDPIWRGIVSRPPRLAPDNVSWLIECLPITHVLRQQLAGGVGSVRPVGIYHHNAAGFALQFQCNGVTGEVTQYFGLAANERVIESAVNDLIYTALAAIGADTYFDSVLLSFNGGGWEINIKRNSTAGLTDFGLWGGSFLCGFVDTLNQVSLYYPVQPGQRSASPPITIKEAFELDSSYTVYLTWDNKFLQYQWIGNEYAYVPRAPACPLGYASHVVSVVSSVPGAKGGARFDPQFFETKDTTWPVWRVYIDKEIEASIDHVTIDGTLGSGNLWKIDARGTTNLTVNGVTQAIPYLDLHPRFLPNPPGGSGFTAAGTTRLGWTVEAPTAGFWGVLGGDTEMKSARTPAEGSVADLIAQLIINGVDANDGDAPWLTDEDFATWQLGDTAVGGDVLARSYQFERPIDVESVLAPELMLAAHFARIESDGRIGIVPMYLPTDTASVADDHTLDDSSIITPADSYGGWIGAEPQADGIVASLLVQQEYDPASDAWLDDPVIIQDPNAIATHKNRGTQRVEIKTYSKPLTSGFNDIVALADVDDHPGLTFLRFVSQDYTTLTVTVPFTKWPILCGDKVKITHRSIPDGLGRRGVTNRVCICVGRSWPLDPKDASHGELTLWMPAAPKYGYTPTAKLSGWTNTSGDIWEVTIDPAEAFNENVSTNADGFTWEHFEVGDLIRVVQWDSRAPTVVVGAVTVAGVYSPGPGTATLTITLLATWTPGDAEVNEWLLEYRDDTDGSLSTAHQRQFSYVADDDQRLPYATTTFARRTA